MNLAGSDKDLMLATLWVRAGGKKQSSLVFFSAEIKIENNTMHL